MKNILSLISVLLLVVCSSAWSSAAQQQTQKPTARDLPFSEHYEYKEFTLPNGLRFLVHQDTAAAGVTVAVYVHVGSKDEPEGKSGFAHLFEHLLFNGTDTNPGEYFKYLDEIGATGANGSTSWDFTNYFETVPREALERVLWLEADRMANVGNQATQKSLETQIEVVKNEKNLSDNQPFGSADYTYLKAMYPAGHPYSHSIIGSVEDLESATLDDVKRWYREYYGAKNTVVALSGNVSYADAQSLAAKYFSHLEPGPSVNKVTSQPIKRSQNTFQTSIDTAPSSALVRSYALPKMDSRQASLAPMAIEIFADGENSFLAKRMIDDLELAQEVTAYVDRRELDTNASIYVIPKEGVSLEHVSAELDKALNDYIKRGPSKSDLERYRGKLRGYLLEEVGRAEYKILSMVESYLLFDDPLYYLQQLDWAEQAKSAELKQAAKEQFSVGYHEQRRIADEARTAQVPQVDLALRPEVGAQAAVSVPKPSTFTLDNGLQVVHIERASSPQIMMTYRNKLGLNNLSPQTHYLFEVMSGVMMQEGVRGLSAEQLIDEQATHSIGLSLMPGADTTQLMLTVSKDDLDKGMHLWSSLLSNAQFKRSSLDDFVKDALEAMQTQAKDPVNYAQSYLFPALVYGKENTVSLQQTMENYQSATTKQLQEVYQDWFKPAGGTLYVVGNISQAELKERLAKSLRGWSGSTAARRTIELDLPANPSQPRFVLVNDEGANQTNLLLRMPINNTHGTDDYVEQLANSILGGGFTSRLNLNLREDKGWTYGIHSQLVVDKVNSALQAETSVTGLHTVAAIKEIQREFNEIVATRPIKQVELEELRTSEIKSFPSQLASNEGLMSLYQAADDINKPYVYADGYADRLRAVSLDQLNTTAKKLLTTNQATWLLIGDLSTFESQLRDAQLGKVEVYDKNGERLR